MCGIAGVYWAGAKPKNAANITDRMVSAILHRGPDSEGRSSTDFAEIGFRRLSIIDLATGDQPMSNELGTVECFLNGEIYNYVALRKELLERGHTLRTSSDTEVLPHLYEELGEKMFAKLNGMFSICVIDHRKQAVLLARDHFGVKQIYYAQEGQAVVFGSEMKAVLASGLIEPEIDQANLLPYLTLFYCPEPHTLVKGVKKIPPGCLLKMSNKGEFQLIRYYELSPQPASAKVTPEDATERFRELFTESVRLQLQADVPVGISLSGGVDSSAIACVASLSRASNQELTALTISWPDTAPEEVACAKRLCKKFGLAHEIIEPAVGTSDIDFTLLGWISDEPIADPATYSQYCIAEAASKRVKVLLGGAGGDELFGGYGHHALSWKKAAYAALPGGLQKLFYDLAAHRWISAESAQALREYRDSRMLWHCLYMSNLGIGGEEQLRQVLPGSGDAFHNFRQVREAYGSCDPVNQQLLIDLHCYLPEQILPMMDRATMAASIEGRVPFIDVPLVEFAFSLSGSMKLGMPAKQKRFLKRALAKWLPPDILWRKKLGMPSHFSSFIQSNRRIVRELLLGVGAYAKTALPAHWIENLLSSDEQVRRSYRVLYALVVLEIWFRLFIRERVYERPTMSLADLCRLPSRLVAGAR